MAAALFVIDIQNDLATDPSSKIPHASRIRSSGEKIISAARAALQAQENNTASRLKTIIFVQHEEAPENGTMVRGSDPWKLVFEPIPGEATERLVPKWTRDTFDSNPGLAAELKASEIDEIIAFGIQSECCVESTCSGALAAGFTVTLLSGAHSTYDSDGKPADVIEREVEERLSSQGVKVVSWEEIVAGWA
ncbi:Isochorismatase-like protein [Corynascus novoguineensis]|uniref:Isochorismatase-like protein n=1 Tax=Corynascus novoguineensis TaxID=1126955 RepID=A0AAN7HNL0_9PEZI|nr:Isochorismatase-like protein [Corynascus novoguineensis]